MKKEIKIKIEKLEKNKTIEPLKEIMFEFGKFEKETLINVIIGKAYLSDGFFNIKKEFSDLFGDDRSLMKIQLGENSKKVIEGYVNRTANGKHGYPRIMAGKEYTKWVQDNFKIGDILKVKMIKNDYLILSK